MEEIGRGTRGSGGGVGIKSRLFVKEKSSFGAIFVIIRIYFKIGKSCYTMAKEKDIFPVYKFIGESPFDAIKRIKKEKSFLKDKKVAYAGRLDPMAEGLLLLITGDELKNFDSYLKHDKEYEAEILFGCVSDTYDILGLPDRTSDISPEKSGIEREIKKYRGKFTFSLPPFSGYKIKGKPLFWWALRGKIEEVDIPEKEVEIYDLQILEFKNIPKQEVGEEIFRKIKKVRGNFRQKKIYNKWKTFLKEEKRDFLPLLKIKINCSSGCYVRSIAQDLGRKTSAGAVLFALKRKKIGEYKSSIT